MDVNATVQSDILLITLDGKLDINSTEIAQNFVRERISNEHNRVVLNLEKVVHVSSIGLRMILVLAQELVEKYSGTLNVACLQPPVERVFEITQLTRDINVFRTVKEATDNFIDN